ncbi:MAG: hypothetical protein IPN63_06355 [Gammaproteobacteria bacterium]|nr:hypothetical protein [Gammaproteobacteria bacterium]MBK9427045.1 hypothetical protein [Gammaproteobacteria bacterium]
MTLPKDRLRKIHGVTEPAGPADQSVLARRKYHEAAAIWLAKWLTPLQALFALLGFFVVLLPVLSKPWRSIVENLPIFAPVFHDYSTFSGVAMANLYIGMLMAFTKLYWAKHSPSGDIVPYKDGIAPLPCPRTRKEEVSFWIETVALILVTSVWLFLPFGVLAYFINIGN